MKMNIEENKKKLADLSDSIDANAPPTRELIPTEVINYTGSKFSKLINSGEQSSYRIRDTEYPVKFKEAIYVHQIFLWPEQSKSLKKENIELSYKDIGGTSHSVKLKLTTDSKLYGLINDSTTELTLKLGNGTFFKPKVILSKINIYGWTSEGIADIDQKISRFHTEYSEYVSLKEKTISEIDSLYAESKELNDSYTQEKNSLREEIDRNQEELLAKEKVNRPGFVGGSLI